MQEDLSVQNKLLCYINTGFLNRDLIVVAWSPEQDAMIYWYLKHVECGDRLLFGVSPPLVSDFGVQTFSKRMYEIHLCFPKKIILNKIIRTATSMLQEDTISESIHRSFVCIHTSQHVELKSRRWRIIIGWRKYSTAVHVTRRAESGYVKKFSFAGLIHKPLQARFAALCEHPRRIQQAPMIKWLAISLSVKRSSHTSKATCRNK